VKDRDRYVGRRARRVRWRRRVLIGPAVNGPLAETAAGQKDRHGARPMIATGRSVNDGRSPKFPGTVDDGRFEKAAQLEIRD
jgi:hypothetical protein